MANIYIKVPWYVACYMRGYDEDNPLTEWDPIHFPTYEGEGRLLENELRYIPEQNQSRLCYSQKAFQNILKGKRPEGGKVFLNRDPKAWPTVQELCTLTGAASTPRQEATDYLCIEMPREVYMNGHVYRTNSFYALGYDTAQHFIKMLIDKFKHEAIAWTRRDWERCVENNIPRNDKERMERFLTQFNFPVAIDLSQRESLRRAFTRWTREAHLMKNRGRNFNHAYLDHISEEEISHRDEKMSRLKRREKKG